MQHNVQLVGLDLDWLVIIAIALVGPAILGLAILLVTVLFASNRRRK